MRILIVDSNRYRSSWGSADLVRLVSLVAPDSRIEVRRAPESDLPQGNFDFVVLSGSVTRADQIEPWTENLDDWIKARVAKDTPLLGICYGHQAIVRALLGPGALQRRQKGEFGWVQLESLAHSGILKGIPNRFFSFSSHFDEIASLPASFDVLCRSEDCEIQAFQLKEKPVFGVQFHPEKDVSGALQSYRECSPATRKIFQNSKKGIQLYSPKIGQTLLKNFFSSRGNS